MIGAYAELGGGGEMTGFGEATEQYHRALEAFIQGDPEPVLTLWSKRDDATLANPFGPPVRGWEAVREAGTRAATQLADGEAFTVELVSAYATTDLAYELEIHRFRARMDGAGEAAPVALRVTTIYRRENDGWRIVHRHADPITGERPAESVTQP
jgi:ketosteroid isomerase-like protein